MLEEVFEIFLLGVMFEVEAFLFVHWIICTKGVDQRYCHNNSKPKGTSKSDKSNQIAIVSSIFCKFLHCGLCSICIITMSIKS